MRYTPLLLVVALWSVLLGAAAPAAVPAAAPASTAEPTPGTVGADGAFASARTPVDRPRAEAAPNATNDTNVLVVPGPAVQRTAVRRATLNLGPSAEFAGNVSAVRMETAAVRDYVEAADTAAERERRILDALSTVEQELVTLRERQQAAIVDYNRGRISTEAFVVELATVGAKAEALTQRVRMLNQLATETEEFDMPGRAAAYRLQLRALTGPVRERAIAAIRGTAPPTRIFVTTGPEGYELTTVTNGTYVREAYRGAVREPATSATLNSTEARNVVKQSYPTIWERQSGDGASFLQSGPTNIVTVTYNDSSLTAFVDSGTERVFKEFQRVPMESFETGPTASNVMGGLNVTVHRGYPGAPIRITVTDAETGAPVNVSVAINQGSQEGVVVGSTGDDGTLWTLSPRGEFSVIASRGGASSTAVIYTSSTEAPDVE